MEDVEEKAKTVLPVKDGKFILSFIHSVQRTPVHEYFKINEDNKLILYKTVYYSLGVGLPFSSGDGEFHSEDGKFILDMNREYNSIHIRVSPIPKHAIKFEDKNYPLLDFVKPDNLLKITAQRKLSIKKRR